MFILLFNLEAFPALPVLESLPPLFDVVFPTDFAPFPVGDCFSFSLFFPLPSCLFLSLGFCSGSGDSYVLARVDLGVKLFTDSLSESLFCVADVSVAAGSVFRFFRTGDISSVNSSFPAPMAQVFQQDYANILLKICKAS